jgi:hypothetical protein
LFEKKDLAIEIFGSNLTLDTKKARGSALIRGFCFRKTIKPVDWCPGTDSNREPID